MLIKNPKGLKFIFTYQLFKMDMCDFGNEQKYLSSVGLTLSIDERVNLELAVLKLYEQEDFDEVKFWGKITGVTKDYYVAIAVNFEGH